MPKEFALYSAFVTARRILTLAICGVACSIVTGTLLGFLPSISPAKSSNRTLSFAERVSYQRAIEDVYWRHRIWPKENPNPKPSLDAVMSQAQLENKVEDYLLNSQAVEDYYKEPLSAGQLQVEMERMARDTKQPEVLRELFEALGNDPLVIAECLARPVLAERMITGLHVMQTKTGALRPEMVAVPTVNYNLPTISDGATGCIDTWTATSTINAPSGRSGHTAVWTGTEMIVWGGLNGNFFNVNTGGRYAPSTDSWTATSTTNAPSGRNTHTAIWSGIEMIVWGGYGGASNYPNTGGRYNPGTDSWTATGLTNAPSGRYQHTAIWTGSEMIVWGGGGLSLFDTGGRYTLGTDSWTASSTMNVPSARELHTAVWTGSEMIVWGGTNGFRDLTSGGRYNPGTDTWTATSPSNAPGARDGHTAVWTGSEMIIWGGERFLGGDLLDSGRRYLPSTDSWTAIGRTNAPSARYLHTAIWTGNEMIIWGGFDSSGFSNTGDRYNPSTDTWIAASITNAPSTRGYHSAIWTGSEMIVWGGYDLEYLNSGGRYCAESGAPTPSPTSTPTATATPTSTATPRFTPTPRPHPTPRPRLLP